MAAALRSSVGLALRRAAAPASSRLSSAGAASANTRVRTMHHNPYGGSRSMFDAEAYSHKPVQANPELDKFDGCFATVAFVGATLFLFLMDGESVVHFFDWTYENSNRQPRMTTRRRR